MAAEPHWVVVEEQDNREQTTDPGQPFIPVQPPLYPQFLMPLNPPQNDYLFLAIISFFFCILLAIPALIFSIKTREANFYGNLKKAKRNSSLALGFSLSSILVGSIAITISTLVSVLKQVV